MQIVDDPLSQEMRAMLSGIDLFRTAADRMRYLTQRQTVIGRNIANTDTPGYKALDVPAYTPAGSAKGPLALVRTEPGHLSAPNTTAAAATAPSVASSLYGEKPNGNTVSLEEQMVKATDVANSFALASSAYAKSISLMKIGIDSGR
jgi:flagellar basal-body rod protein FlgB